MTKALRILIVRIGAMGDVLHGMPAVAGLRLACPDCFIGWAVEPRWMPLLRSEAGEMPLVDRVHAVRTHEWKQQVFSVGTARGIGALRRELQAERYDLCIDLQGSIKSVVVGHLAGAKRLIGLDAPRERLARLLYGERVRVASHHVIDQAAEIVSRGLGLPISAAPIRLPRGETAEWWCNSILAGLGGLSHPDSPIALIAPTAGWGAKEWGPARYAALAQGLIGAGFRVAVNKTSGSPPGIAEEISVSSGAVVIESTLPQLIALTRHAALVVGGDTGPIHLASALGVPVVALFGPTDPERNGPAFPGARVRILRDASSRTDHRRHTQTEAGLARIQVEEVLAASLAISGE